MTELDNLNNMLKLLVIVIQSYEFSSFSKILKEVTTGEKVSYLINQIQFNLAMLDKKMQSAFKPENIELINEKLIKLAGRLSILELELMEFNTEEKKLLIEDFDFLRNLRFDLSNQIVRYNRKFPKEAIFGLSKALKLWFTSSKEFKDDNMKRFDLLEEDTLRY
jgi:hypothetical protein